MKTTPLHHISFLTALFAAVFLSLTPLAVSDEGAMPLETAADFAAIANNAFPGIVQPIAPVTSPVAGTGAPSGQAADPEPVDDSVTWGEYLDGLDTLNGQLENGNLTEAQWFEKTQALRARFIRGEQHRDQGFFRARPYGRRPISVRGIQIERDLINVGEIQEVD